MSSINLKKNFKGVILMDNEGKIQVIEEKINGIKSDITGVKDDVSSLFKKYDEVVSLSTSLQVLSNTVNDLKTVVNKLSEKPEKRYEAIVGSVISGIIGILIGFVAFKLGMK